MADEMTGDSALTPAEARKRVDDLLLSRLRAAGYRKPKGLAQADFDTGQGALADRLAYLTPDNLETLAESIVDVAPLPNFPPERWMLDLARSLQPPPPKASRLLSSWLASIEGPRAVMRGDLVQLYRHLRDKKVPPTDWERRQIAERALSDAHDVQLWRDRLARGVISEADRAALARHEADLADALAIVDAGNAARAAKGEAA